MAAKTKLALELDGQVNIVEMHGKKRVSVQVIDGKTVLKMLKESLCKEPTKGE